MRDGRRFLYDARATSSNGEASCASCRVFGDLDSLSGDLGNPDDVVAANPNPIGVVGTNSQGFHPMKGPMTTQTLRGLANHGPMHWRGDRTGGEYPLDVPVPEPAALLLAFAGGSVLAAAGRRRRVPAARVARARRPPAARAWRPPAARA